MLLGGIGRNTEAWNASHCSELITRVGTFTDDEFILGLIHSCNYTVQPSLFRSDPAIMLYRFNTAPAQPVCALQYRAFYRVRFSCCFSGLLKHSCEKVAQNCMNRNQGLRVPASESQQLSCKLCPYAKRNAGKKCCRLR